MYFLLLVLLGSCASTAKKSPAPRIALEPALQAPRPYTGLQIGAQFSHFNPPLSHNTRSAIRVENVMPHSPAWKVGIVPGDLILEEKSPQDFLNKMNNSPIGTEFKIKILSGVTLKSVKIKSIERSTGNGLRYAHSPQLWRVPTQNTYLEKKIGPLRDKDLDKKFKELSSYGDKIRPDGIRFLQENPLALFEASQELLQRLGKCSDSAHCLESLAFLKTSKYSHIKLRGKSAASHLEYITKVLRLTEQLNDRAFAKLSSSEKKFLENNIDEISNRFMETIYVHEDTFVGRKNRFYDFSQIINKVSIQDLQRSLLFLTSHFNEAYFKRLAKDLSKNRLPLVKKTSNGLIVIAGKENNDHTKYSRERVALLIDLGGDDIYRDNSGILVDLNGNDRYEASLSWILGAARMQTSLFMDLEGDDTYECGVHCLGSSFLGAVFFADLKGNDTYSSQVYSQGTSFSGVSLFLDAQGNDKYRSFGFSQGVGIAGGYGFMLDKDGNDVYQSLGIRPSAYGDAGQFESWSQGVGLGLRFFISGGIGVLYDKRGNDIFEAGTFSQGGGYANGWGALINDGTENDIYKGMRYTQGFTAHSAIGTFIDVGGDDQYHSLSVVGEGMAWDLSATLFEDKSGKDRYQTGAHCLGAASHSSYAFFFDHKGLDTYVGVELPAAQAIPNDYHGGKSLGYFLDSGGEEDIYEVFKNNSCQKRVGDHILCDE